MFSSVPYGAKSCNFNLINTVVIIRACLLEAYHRIGKMIIKIVIVTREAVIIRRRIGGDLDPSLRLSIKK